MRPEWPKQLSTASVSILFDFIADYIHHICM